MFKQPSRRSLRPHYPWFKRAAGSRGMQLHLAPPLSPPLSQAVVPALLHYLQLFHFSYWRRRQIWWFQDGGPQLLKPRRLSIAPSQLFGFLRFLTPDWLSHDACGFGSEAGETKWTKLFFFRGCQLGMTGIWRKTVGLFLSCFLKRPNVMAAEFLFKSTQWRSMLLQKGKCPHRLEMPSEWLRAENKMVRNKKKKKATGEMWNVDVQNKWLQDTSPASGLVVGPKWWPLTKKKPGSPDICQLHVWVLQTRVVAPGDMRCRSRAHEVRYLFQEANCHFVAR